MLVVLGGCYGDGGSETLQGKGGDLAFSHPGLPGPAPGAFVVAQQHPAGAVRGGNKVNGLTMVTTCPNLL